MSMPFGELLQALSIDAGLGSFGGLVILGSLLLFAAMLYAAVRELRSAYVQQGRRFSRCRLTGRVVAGRLLEHLGLPPERIDDGAKMDHYDMWRRRVRLRTESSVSSSVAALAIAAHEVGHAEQFSKGYWAARATRLLLILLVIGAVPLLAYPFAVNLAGGSDANLTGLVALGAIAAVLRLPFTIALELDATRRAKRLLAETSLADASEQAGIARLLRAGFLTHVALGVGLVVLISACTATMWVVESGCDARAITSVRVAAREEVGRNAARLPQPAIAPEQPVAEYAYPTAAIGVSVVLVWWAFRGRPRTTSARSAVDANNEGMARFQAGDLEGAMSLIDEALRRDPGLAPAHYNRAVVLISQGRNNESLASIEAMFASRPKELEPMLTNSDLWQLRGTLRLNGGDCLGAIDDLSRALDCDPPEAAPVLRNRGLAWLKLGDMEKALGDTDEALRLAPNDSVAYNNRGVIYRERGDIEQAEADLRQAIAIDPQFSRPQEHLAGLLELRAAAKERSGAVLPSGV
jgi:Zn-dependent membrane protease YugP/Flp pilus assembly protein TadD